MTKEQLEKEAKTECFMLTVNTIGIDQRDVELAYILGRNKSIEQIEALKRDCDETQELLDKQIEATYKVVEENTDLKAKYDTCLRENTGLKIHNAYVEKKLAEAKYILNEFMWISKAGDEDFEHDYSELIEEAEKFIKEVK